MQGYRVVLQIRMPISTKMARRLGYFLDRAVYDAPYSARHGVDELEPYRYRPFAAPAFNLVYASRPATVSSRNGP